MEVRQWLHLSVRLDSANKLIGEQAYKRSLNKKLEIYIVALILGGVCWTIYLILDASLSSSSDINPSEKEQQQEDNLIEQYTKSTTFVSAGIGIVFFFPPIGFCILGY